MAPSRTRLARRIRRRVDPVLELPGDWWTARQLGRHQPDTIIEPVEQWTPHVAIIATFPRSALIASISRLVDHLDALGITVIVVANDAPDRQRCTEVWSEQRCSIIHRPNLGRDFGAYRCGMDHLLSHAPTGSVERVSFFNDSVAHLPTSMDLLTAWLREPVGNLSLATTRLDRPGVQGFAMSLDGPTALSSPMLEFWRRHVPSNDRSTVIRRGEQRLSAVLRESPRPPIGFLTFERLDEALDGDWGRLTDDEVDGLRWAVGFSPRIAAAVADSGLDLDRPELRRMIAREIPQWIGPNRPFGLVAAGLLGFPLKLDLIAVGAASRSGVARILEQSGVSDQEQSELLALMEAHQFGR